MKNIRINYRTTSPSVDKIKKFIDSFPSKNNVVFKVYDFSRDEVIIEDDSFLYQKMSYEDIAVSNDLIISDSKQSGAGFCAIFNDNVRFVGDLDAIVSEFDKVTGSVYSDYKSDGVYVYLKSPPVHNMTAVLLFVDLDKIQTDKNMIESVFSSFASKHIPEALCLVSNE